MTSVISSKIPDYLLKEMDTWNLWAEKPQVEFEDSIIAERIKEFDKELQISTALLLKVDKINDVYNKSVLEGHSPGYKASIAEFFYKEYLHVLNTLPKHKIELEERIGRLRKEDKSSYTLLDWIKDKNFFIERGFRDLSFQYDMLHEKDMHCECTK